MAFRIQIRRDLSTKWEVNNPVLLEGEIGYTTDTQYMKIGDGDTAWNELDYWNGPSKYKVYSVLLTQTDTNPPVPTVLENTLGFTPEWEYFDTGIYGFTQTGAFPIDKTFVITPVSVNGATGDPEFKLVDTSGFPDTFRIFNGVGDDNVYHHTPLEIRVYK